MKTCNICRVSLPADKFSKRAASPDGLNYTCRVCSAARAAAWRESNPGAFKEWHEKNRQDRNDYCRQWAQENKTLKASLYNEWASCNKHRINALIARRRAAKRSASPKWADQNAIRVVYEAAARMTVSTGIRHEVDHIYPLQSDLVCGLHCEANLRVITKTANLRKFNHLPECEP